MVEVTTYAEALEAFRSSSKLAVVLDEDSVPVRGGTVLRIDGEAHARRRRVLNRLVLRDRHNRFRREALYPAVERNLAALFADAGADGIARTDLVSFCRRLFVELMAAMIGLDQAGTAKGVEELVRVQAQTEAFLGLKTQLRGAAPPLPGGEVGLQNALARLEAGKREFVERFYRPSLATHQRLFARHQAGEIPESELPNDFLMLVASHADPSFDEDPDLPVREAIADLLHAGTGTTVGAVVHTVDELDRWFADHPKDRELRTDPHFLAGAVNEVLRLHSANPAEVRRALEDVQLSGGTVIKARQYVALRTGIANRDRSVFGPDADRFDPHRRVPAGVYRHGLAFGSGPHMCLGILLALGNEGIDGNVVYLLNALYQAGMQKDPERPARYRPGIAHADLKGFDSYPVRFVQETGAGPSAAQLGRSAGR